MSSSECADGSCHNRGGKSTPNLTQPTCCVSGEGMPSWPKRHVEQNTRRFFATTHLGKLDEPSRINAFQSCSVPCYLTPVGPSFSVCVMRYEARTEPLIGRSVVCMAHSTSRYLEHDVEARLNTLCALRLRHRPHPRLYPSCPTFAPVSHPAGISCAGGHAPPFNRWIFSFGARQVMVQCRGRF